MVSVGGLASGLDTNSIINQLVELERRPINALQQEIAQLQQLQATFTGFSPSFASLRSAAAGLSLSNLDQPSTSVSPSSADDDAAISISAAATAVPGRHDITVAQLATASRLGSQGFADTDASPIAGGPGSFVIQSGSSGGQISVSVTSTTTMEDLVAAINAADGDITASIIDDGTNALSKRLVLTSSQTGLDNAIQVVTNGTTLEFGANRIEAASADDDNSGTYTGAVSSGGTYTGTANKTFIVEIVTGGAVGAATYRVSEDGGRTWDDNGPGPGPGPGYTTSAVAGTLGGNGEGVEVDFSAGGTLTTGDRFYIDVSNPTLVTAQDAVFTLDGIVQTRSSNQVTDALQGVTIDIASTTTSSVGFAVTQDDEQVVSAVEDFVDAYNDLFNGIRGQQSFDADTFDAGILLGDRTANTILSQLRSTLVRQVSGTGLSFDSLASLGITSSRTGGLTMNAGSLRDALSTNREQVLAVLASTESTSASTLSVVNRPRESNNDGSYPVRVTTAPEVARVTAGGVQTSPLGATETLSFQYSANASESPPTNTNFSVVLQAGDTLGTVVNRLNSAFATQGVRLNAFASASTLTIESTEFGADYSFSVSSDVASGPVNTTQIGVGTSTGTGVDIVGTINGEAATGRGNVLELGETSNLDDFAISYTGSATGLVGAATISTGVGSAFTDLVDALNSGSGSIVGVRNSSIQAQIDDIEERIVTREEQVARTQARLEEQFAALEVQLAGIQSQADFLTNQLAQLSSTNQRSGS